MASADSPLRELHRLELLAQADDLVTRLKRFAEPPAAWQPIAKGQAVVRRLLERVDTLRSRLQAPLVVATFGGTGTGKSALVNALVGQECSASGRQRPTTTRPVLLTHPDTDLSRTGLPLETFEIKCVASEMLRELLILDCPDPDTTEAETSGSNLALLHSLLPWCDVLLYVSTQQKYRSARVTTELLQAATGCRLVFVQTNADLDSDIREDWQRHLAPVYHVPEIFLVDSLTALRAQQRGEPLTGDFPRLRELLRGELSAGRRAQIRRANLLDLVGTTLDRCQHYSAEKVPALDQLERNLSEQESRQIERMSTRLRDELLESRQLWERRLLHEVVTRWSLTPFSAVLRIYNSLGTLLASAGMFRARGTVQLAVIGALQGVRWLQAKHEEAAGENRLQRLSSLGLDESLLRETQLVVSGYARDAGFDAEVCPLGDLQPLREEASRVEGRFLDDATERIDQAIAELANVRTRSPSRWVYELLLGLLLLYVIGWPAYSFFIAHPLLGKELVPSDFYIHGFVFTVLWSAVLVMIFTARLRSGLVEKVSDLARQLAQQRLGRGLFPKLEEADREARRRREELAALAAQVQLLREPGATSGALGGTRAIAQS